MNKNNFRKTFIFLLYFMPVHSFPLVSDNMRGEFFYPCPVSAVPVNPYQVIFWKDFSAKK